MAHVDKAVAEMANSFPLGRDESDLGDAPGVVPEEPGPHGVVWNRDM